MGAGRERGAGIELHETYRRNQFDGPVAGGAPADVVWPGAQLWIRTARYAYTAYLELFPANQTISPGSAAAPDTAGTAALALGSFRLVDETLYDTGGSDPEEANNVAYDAAYQAQRARLLETNAAVDQDVGAFTEQPHVLKMQRLICHAPPHGKGIPEVIAAIGPRYFRIRHLQASNFARCPPAIEAWKASGEGEVSVGLAAHPLQRHTS